ncbi:MAG TPA: phytanoyl-CoA dioxygenase family protein [Acidimicrobiales bacterium]|nr:phytanoyl-CoA dioxygenase family protein [Acidimicrobiales bacterium]
MSTTTLLAREYVEQFERDGYVVIPDLISDEELDRYNTLVTDAVKTRTAGDDRPLEEKSRYQQSFVQCMNLWEDFEDIRPLTFHPRLGQAAAELLSVDAVRLWHDQALYKQAGGRPTDAHQDHPYWPMKETPSITAWIPFEGSTLASGALGYLPGTHDIGLRKFVNIFFGEPEDILAEPGIVGVEPVFVEVPKGSVAFHHGLTVHLAKPNVTDRDRAVHTIIYFKDGNTRGYPNPHFAVERGGVEVGQPIASDVTPIVWPRPDGDLPPTPKVPMVMPAGVANKGAGPS